ncbi:MAG: Na/Pi cotransporter family protein [Proteobacteria bacterium]|nr:Na/Pi cotransporter family protein [Pseudomonadota bacterium]
MNSINWLGLMSGLAGGLGLFLYGMKMMSEGLQKVAGNGLRGFLEKLTMNRVVGTMAGAIVTAIIQSSSATTVMVVGFVNAGLMDLMQALSVVLGANVGTTITAQLISFKVGALAYPAIGLGVVLRMFTHEKKIHYYGEVLIGFGLLFTGLDVMKDSFVPLKHNEAFRHAFVYFSTNPLMAVFAGAILTMVVQSSSATIGITIALASTGLIDFYAACALVLGENIGTTITANLAAIGTSPTARRAAFGHFLINVLGVAYMLFFLKLFIAGVDWFTPGDPNFINAEGIRPDIDRHIANLHTGFNILNVIVFLPILHLLAKLCEKIIPGKDSIEHKLLFLDDRLIETPSFGVSQAIKEVKRMSGVSIDMLKLSKECFFERDRKKINAIFQHEKTVDLLERDITKFLVKLNQQPISEQTSQDINSMLNVLHDLEKIGDYAENIAKYTEKIIDGNVVFSEPAMTEIGELFDVAIRFAEEIIKAYNKGGMPKKVNTDDEDLIDSLRKQLRMKHIDRLHDGSCTVENGILYIDILNNLEKTGDQVFNIAQIVMGEIK